MRTSLFRAPILRILAFWLCALALSPTRPAQAHAMLMATSPAEGALWARPRPR